MDKDDLGKRMKTFYEQVPKTKLLRRTPVAIRIDGKAFHTFTKGFQEPFDEVLICSMQETMKYLCENIQGCVLGYTQSDEITLLLVDYKKLTSSAWFDYEVQKICSVAASMATMAFNKFFAKNADRYGRDNIEDWDDGGTYRELSEKEKQCLEYTRTYWKAIEKGAMFDARCFNIPKEEVTNLIYWRQLDASRNSIQMVGQANFSHKELQNKSCSDIQDMLMLQRNINWNDLPTYQKRGSCCIKEEYAVNDNGEEVEVDCVTDVDELVKSITFRSRWIVDTDIPIFTGEHRSYIDSLIYLNDD